MVTGANSGLGFYVSKNLAARGARVIMGCRSLQKGQAAANLIRKDNPGVEVIVMGLDLADLASVRSFSETLAKQIGGLDLLINNAGVMALPYRKTVDGFEMQFGTNHLGHFALTGLLLPRLLEAQAGRVVTVSSAVHTIGKISFADLNSESSYSKWRAYAQSKLANLLFAYELQRRLEAGGFKLISLAAHPGYAATNLQLAGPRMTNNSLMIYGVRVGNRLVAQPAEMGALPVLFAATSPDVQGCDYVGPRGLFGSRGYPVKVYSTKTSYDVKTAERLWAISEEMTGVKYEVLDRSGLSS